MACEDDPAWYNRRAPRIIRDMVRGLHAVEQRISYICGYDEGYAQALRDITEGGIADGRSE